jgi:cell wall-associated NlpC family hydrolase
MPVQVQQHCQLWRPAIHTAARDEHLIDDLRDETEERAIVTRVAREWLRTPYHSHARVKGAGCDCLTFIVEVFHEGGFIPQIEIPYYSPMWHLSRSEELYINAISKYCHEKDGARPLPGDLMLIKIARVFAHAAIVLEWPLCVHALMGRGVVYCDATNDGNLIGRPRRFFSLW